MQLRLAGEDITPFTDMKSSLMKLLGMPDARVKYDDLCTTDGHFKPVGLSLNFFIEYP